MLSDHSFSFASIGVVHSCYRQKFGIPRQPGLVTEATARIELLSPFNRLDTLEGLQSFSHIWVHFIFHACLQEGWKAKIRPPRLGGKNKVGVFATRSTHRPNPIGLSVVKLGKIYKEDKKVFIDLHGADLLDGTPVIDIKPYLPYADAIPEAKDGFAPISTVNKEVIFTKQAEQDCIRYKQTTQRDIRSLIKQIIAQDPRPAYLINKTEREHGMQLWNVNVKWKVHTDYFEVLYLEDCRQRYQDE
ncbi:tRNA (N6-threonylcarbamoyladenosine(37)-N6)-methyltransferase TrmO [Marinomonas agarivorans]|nr:tRNA (N6-threonylcarbamoyladenosine(37)-N6)-methyltransferase TrmO [Marinomonas agarivorans]